MLSSTEEEVLKLKWAHESSLMAIENVTGVGVGSSSDGDPCIRVYVSELTPAMQDRIPRYLNGVKVEIHVSGSIDIF